MIDSGKSRASAQQVHLGDRLRFCPWFYCRFTLQFVKPNVTSVRNCSNYLCTIQHKVKQSTDISFSKELTVQDVWMN